jgi:hypothetical protein
LYGLAAVGNLLVEVLPLQLVVTPALPPLDLLARRFSLSTCVILVVLKPLRFLVDLVLQFLLDVMVDRLPLVLNFPLDVLVEY